MMRGGRDSGRDESRRTSDKAERNSDDEQRRNSGVASANRRTFLGIAGAVLSGRRPSLRRTATPSAVGVSTAAELEAALGEAGAIRFEDDVTLTGPIRSTLGSTDTVLDLDGHTLAKADGTNDSMLALRTEGSLTVRNGRVDCNRRGQDFPRAKSKEIRLFGGRDCRVLDVALVDNSNYGFDVQDFETVAFENPAVDSRPREIADPRDAAGLDGVHTFDCPRVEIRNPQIESGDDAVAIAANDRSVEDALVAGGRLSSPVHANGVRLHVQSGAAADATVRGVEVRSAIRDCRGQGVAIANESENGNAIRDVTVAGTIRNTRDDGIRAFDPVENLAVTARIADSGANGVNLADGGRNVAIAATVERAAVNGVHAVDAREVVVAGSAIRECDNWPVISKGESDRWTVVDNTWCDNRFASPSLANEHNVVAMNRSGSRSCR